MNEVYEIAMQSIYIFERHDGLCKIGVSCDPDFRKKTICSIGGIEALKKTFQTEACSNALEIEHLLHKHYKNSRKTGEWFEIDFDEATEKLKSIFIEKAVLDPKTHKMITPEMIDEVFAKKNYMPLPIKENVNELPAIKTWQGKRVVTFKDIDSVHGRTPGTSKRNFNSNKHHFIENEDYYFVTKEDLNVRNSSIGNIPPRGLTLLTETGYLMIVKSFTDDLSWEVQRRLVNSYFNAKETTLPVEIPACVLAKNRQKTWSEQNLWKFKKICHDMDWEMKYLHHKILTEVGDLWNLDVFKDNYYKKYYREPRYNMDLINEFPHLQEIANKYLDFLMEFFGNCIG